MADLPDELVQAAAEALKNTSDGRLVVGWGTLAAAALQAAFAKLPECEAVIMAVAEGMPHGWADDDGVAHHVVSKGDYARAKAYLAALAREFGGQE